MPDLTIKPNAGSGNKLIIKDQANGAVLTTADSGAAIANCTFPGKLLASVQTFAAAGAVTWTKPAGVTAVLVYVTGGGGSGGRHTCGSAGSNPTYSAGGGAGGTAIKWITSGLGSTETVTIGAGGPARDTGTAYQTGAAGGTSSFGSHCSATGGAGGQQGCAGAVEGGANGVGSSGNINLEGSPGEDGAEPSVASNLYKTSAGRGGESFWGGGGRGATGYDTSVAPEAGVKGSGGGGTHGNQQSQSSGAGGAGYCVVWEYVG